MDIPYRYTENIKINQHTKDADTRRIDGFRVAVIMLPHAPRKPHWERLAYADVLKTRFQRRKRKDKHACQLLTDLPNTMATRVILQTVEPDSSHFELLSSARKIAAELRVQDPAAVLLHIVGFEQPTAARIAESLSAAILASVCPMPSYKSDADKPAALKRIDVYGLAQPVDLAQVQAESIGNHLTRWLSALPANELTPTHYREFVSQLAADEGWKMDFLNTRALARRKAGAFLAVAQASPVDDAGIVHLRYRPAGRGGKRLALVGKGICFDTGGVNVKPARYMNGMHEDMQGSAVALGTLLALTRLGLEHPIDCWLALAQNHIGSKAYKPNDVVTASNGTTIEVIHTDAEGRMVLADTLALACKEKPQLLIDYATLTGACIYSLSSRYSGVFSNRDALHAVLTTAGRDSGERVWPFPLDKDFDDDLKSTLADTKQCTLEGEADHILAARFLNRFVDGNIDWIHVDLAASHRKGGLGHIPTDTTGFGVRYTLNLLLQQGVLEQSWN
ncbi:MAG: leucyl aminopeptidase family protein [Gammaproteobacteria bacterium]|nr:leucyl aminopeptidase family protein [Gammaproteobacteria bacterium]